MKFLIFLGLVFSQFTYADEADETVKAIEKVQAEMQSVDFMRKAAKESKEAAEVQNHVQTLSGSSANEAEIYKLAAEVLGNMKGHSTAEMMKILEAAKNDPSAFANSWTPEQRKKLKELAERLPAAQHKNP